MEDLNATDTAATELPAWCNVYEDLTDAEVAEIETSIVRSPGGRTFACQNLPAS